MTTRRMVVGLVVLVGFWAVIAWLAVRYVEPVACDRPACLSVQPFPEETTP